MNDTFEHVETKKRVKVEYISACPFTGQSRFYFTSEDTPKGVHLEREASEFATEFKEVPRDG